MVGTFCAFDGKIKCSMSHTIWKNSCEFSYLMFCKIVVRKFVSWNEVDVGRPLIHTSPEFQPDRGRGYDIVFLY